MKKENIYIDLSKCSEEELKNIYTILGDTLKFISPSIVFNFPIMHYHEGMWIRTNFFQDKAKEDSFLEDKTELTYPEFIKLFEGETCPKCRTKDFENCHSIRCPMRNETIKSDNTETLALHFANTLLYAVKITDNGTKIFNYTRTIRTN